MSFLLYSTLINLTNAYCVYCTVVSFRLQWIRYARNVKHCIFGISYCYRCWQHPTCMCVSTEHVFVRPYRHTPAWVFSTQTHFQLNGSFMSKIHLNDNILVRRVDLVFWWNWSTDILSSLQFFPLSFWEHHEFAKIMQFMYNTIKLMWCIENSFGFFRWSLTFLWVLKMKKTTDETAHGM